jgi:hypothetical protein
MIVDEKFYVGMMSNHLIWKMVRIIEKFPSRKSTGIYVITLPLFGDGMLEIYPIDEFRQNVYKDMLDNIRVVGAAPTKRAASWLVRDIIEDIYLQTGDVDVKSYFGAKGD